MSIHFIVTGSTDWQKSRSQNKSILEQEQQIHTNSAGQSQTRRQVTPSSSTKKHHIGSQDVLLPSLNTTSGSGLYTSDVTSSDLTSGFCYTSGISLTKWFNQRAKKQDKGILEQGLRINTADERAPAAIPPR
ncbi:uncharacterized protein LOC117334533 [Pecten maximus]|uniref:uncharacterized protein LOC117334533 n=1 Tax=Pecten maximus TaxID=6579 RepID=UPI001458656F|nr:uncharacterized protein LOC117334533 [Pecten maximus]